MKTNEFVKSVGLVEVKKYINNAHRKATHIYVGFVGVVSYFYQHPTLGWCEVDNRTIGWDSDRCCYDVHPPISSMFVINDLKRLVESHELVESYGGLASSKLLVNYPNFLNDEDVMTANNRLNKAIADVESCM